MAAGSVYTRVCVRGMSNVIRADFPHMQQATTTAATAGGCPIAISTPKGTCRVYTQFALSNHHSIYSKLHSTFLPQRLSEIKSSRFASRRRPSCGCLPYPRSKAQRLQQVRSVPSLRADMARDSPSARSAVAAVAIAAIPQVAVTVIAFPVLSSLTGPTQFGRRPRPRRRFLFFVDFDFQKRSYCRFVQIQK